MGGFHVCSEWLLGQRAPHHAWKMAAIMAMQREENPCWQSWKQVNANAGGGVHPIVLLYLEYPIEISYTIRSFRMSSGQIINPTLLCILTYLIIFFSLKRSEISLKWPCLRVCQNLKGIKWRIFPWPFFSCKRRQQNIAETHFPTH